MTQKSTVTINNITVRTKPTLTNPNIIQEVALDPGGL